MEKGIDRSYYDAMVDAAVNDISQHGDFEWFVSDDPYVNDIPPWETADAPWDDDQGAIFNVR